MAFESCGSVLNTCVLSLAASVAALIAGFVAYAKVKKVEKKNGF